MASRISQNRPFGNRPNSNSRIGPSYFNWCPVGYNNNSICNNGSNILGKRGRGGLTGTITPAPDMAYSSTIIESVTENCFEFQSQSQVILKIKITTTGSNNPINIDKFTLQVGGVATISQLLASPYNARIYYTGNNNNYSSGNMFGSANFGNLSKTSQITGTQDLLEGDNYFWVVYKDFTTLNSACFDIPSPDCNNCYKSFATDLNSISINQVQITLSVNSINGCLSCV